MNDLNRPSDNLNVPMDDLNQGVYDHVFHILHQAKRVAVDLQQDTWNL